VDAMVKGLTIDFKNAGDPSLKDSHRRQFDRYEVLKMAVHPELIDDNDEDEAAIFFLQHASPRAKVHTYHKTDYDSLLVSLVNDCKVCLTIQDTPIKDCRPRPDWLCNYCPYPVRCSKDGGISGDLATLLTTPEGRVQAVERLVIIGAEYDGLRRSLENWVDINGNITLPDGRRWGAKRQRSKKLDQSDLFKLGCKCNKHECLPWVMLSMQPDLKNTEKLARGNKSLLEALVRSGYTPEQIKAIVENAQNLITYEDGRTYYEFIK
jgi:hypothetical protein